MSDFLVTYDLQATRPDPHSEFLAQAEAQGWAVYMWGPTSKKWLRLPNTTLFGSFNNKDAAKKAFDAAATNTRSKNFKVVVEKYILVEVSDWMASSDVKIDSP